MADAHRPEDALEGLDLEAGMEAAYDAESAVGTADRSVLARLCRDGREVVPLLLRDEESGADLTPVVRPKSDEMPRGGRGRYRMLGEIARGGVGVVLKGQDVDLGREVAMKVIRKEHEDNADIIQRFVEEAQIGGQLQHPGVVPVYEVGLGEDGRPYFTMKLVKGRTFSALLARRASPSEARRRCLSIFESVCQTIGYAHARGVLHRDLKPSNIMVGAFGEVLVVDWGMGKVLRSGGVDDERSARIKADQTVVTTHRSGSEGSGSVVGSVMGTPRYMPPEQARGDIDLVNEQSDVFSLGAVLCEILTGQPPYIAEGREALAEAAMAKLSGAMERLDASGADPKLIEITKRCLAPAPAARPANAGELAQWINAYLSGLEERLEKAKFAAVKARTQAKAATTLATHEKKAAAQARKARWVTTGLAATILAFVVVGTQWTIGHAEEEQRRLSATATQVDAALGRATYLAERAEKTQELEVWADALEAVKGAAGLLDAGNPDDGVLSRYQAALADIEPKAKVAAAYLRGVSEAEALKRKGKDGAALARYTRLTEETPTIALAHTRRGSL